MRRSGTWAVIVCLSIWLAPQSGEALTLYTDRTAFENLPRSFSLETFETAPLTGTPSDGAVYRQSFPDFKVSAKKPYPAISTRIPEKLDYDAVRGLSIEDRQKLKAQRPETVGQASRISAVTPAAISLLRVYIKRLNKAGGGKLAA